jgi:hypothetical protein
MTEQSKLDLIISDEVMIEIAKRVHLARSYIKQQLPDDFDRPAFSKLSTQRKIKRDISEALKFSIPDRNDDGSSPTAGSWIDQMNKVREKLKEPLPGISEVDWRLVVNYYDQQVSGYWNFARDHFQAPAKPIPNNVVSLFGPHEGRDGIVSPSDPEKER